MRQLYAGWTGYGKVAIFALSLSWPVSAAKAANQVWVFSGYGPNIYRYDFNGNSVGSFGGPTASNLTVGLTATSSQVWAITAYGPMIYRYDFNGNSQGSFGGPVVSNQEIATTATLNQVWVLAAYGPTIYRYDFSGTSQGSFGGPTVSNLPFAMTSTPNQVWVYAGYGPTIYRYDFNGNSLGSFGGPTASNLWVGLTTTSSQVWPFAEYGPTIYRYDFNGNSQGSFGGPTLSNQRFTTTRTLNQVWALSAYGPTIYRYDFNGNSQGSFGGPTVSNLPFAMTSIVERDCNSNGIPDGDDITAHTSNDCNVNANPDECDIASGTSGDCNTDGIPDECQTDCNTNGQPDVCDLASGTSMDCNTDGIPDECDIRSGTSTDCNTNGIPDICDISGGTSADCNTNGIADECEPNSGFRLWTGEDGGDFSTPSNWSPSGVPGSAGRAVLANTAAGINHCILGAGGTTLVCSLDASASGSGHQILQINSGSVLRTLSGTSISSGGDVDLRGGEIAGAPITNTGNSLVGYGTLSTNVINAGTIQGAAGFNLFLTGASFTNQSAGRLLAPFGAFVIVQSATFTQAGYIEIRPFAGMLFSQPLVNTAGGNITLLDGSLGAAGLTNGAGATINGFGTIDSGVTNQGNISIIANTEILGNLINDGTVTIQSGILTVTGNLSGSGTIIGGFGGRNSKDVGLLVRGDLDIASTDPRQINLTTATVQMDGDPMNGLQTLEVLAADVGSRVNLPNADLFSIGKLRIGPTATTVRLVDRHRNSPSADRRFSGARPEALYVSRLLLDSGTTLDLAGLHLYYGSVMSADALARGSNVRVIDSVGGGALARLAQPAKRLAREHEHP